jgi:hypothetical protein
MQPTNHVNFMDSDGHIYCCLRNKVVKFDQEQKERFCHDCKMFAGFADGRGVECEWEDLRGVNNPYIVVDPVQEFLSNQRRSISLENISELDSFCT